MNGFTEFWRAYPRRVGKLAAQKAYQKARKHASAEAILKGVAAYIAHKPEYADWCHPSTFLTQGRWLDEYDVPAQRPRYECPHDPRCSSKEWCRALQMRERGEIA